ncbi:hypothetical protein L810_8829 [Burkholderia sp. AU4i]|nr:hypothetical protein L810_8829 [Burkholderia sp. AU4i]MDW9230364.1 hypothetical protein [Burkholderia cepacia]MDW9250092.1 hypothetical protein [Burkholderia cepacia]QOH37542.1 hypothetical protein C7S14_0723 [Burkholderia cepacia]
MTKNKGLKPKLKARPAWVSRSSRTRLPTALFLSFGFSAD